MRSFYHKNQHALKFFYSLGLCAVRPADDQFVLCAHAPCPVRGAR